MTALWESYPIELSIVALTSVAAFTLLAIIIRKGGCK